MIPYHHYPKVSLYYCRCDHCGNDLRSRILSRLFEKRQASMPDKPWPKYKLKRRRRLIPKVKRRVQPPAYKQRRELKIMIQKKLAIFRNVYERKN